MGDAFSKYAFCHAKIAIGLHCLSVDMQLLVVIQNDLPAATIGTFAKSFAVPKDDLTSLYNV